MEYKIVYVTGVQKDLESIDKKTARKILDKIDYFVATGVPLKYAKKLVNFEWGTYRFRIGDYRAIFDVDDEGNILVLLILKIGHRKDIYL
ncbi:MAG: Plasmid stabilization system protein [uncultured bacterium]|nr:MAG: Plasmid stabilization system protein [uncultured bacterium]